MMCTFSCQLVVKQKQRYVMKNDNLQSRQSEQNCLISVMVLLYCIVLYCIVSIVSVNSQILRPTQLPDFNNVATWFGPLFGPSSVHCIPTLKNANMYTKIYTIFCDISYLFIFLFISLVAILYFL